MSANLLNNEDYILVRSLGGGEHWNPNFSKDMTVFQHDGVPCLEVEAESDEYLSWLCPEILQFFDVSFIDALS